MRLTIKIILCVFAIFTIQANQVKEFFTTIAWDAIDINYNVFSKQSINTLVATAPFFILAYQKDKQIHSKFYYRPEHKNLNQWPKYTNHVSSAITASTIISNVGLALFYPTSRLQKSAEMFSIGLPFANLVKNIFKRLKFDWCLRPRNEHFDRYKRTYGGFPSGHMMIMSYATSLYGLQFGPPAWIPLGLLSTYIFTHYIVSNRHTSSQLVAGIALGTIYGISSSKVVDSRLAKLTKNFSVTPNSISFEYKF